MRMTVHRDKKTSENAWEIREGSEQKHIALKSENEIVSCNPQEEIPRHQGRRRLQITREPVQAKVSLPRTCAPVDSTPSWLDAPLMARGTIGDDASLVAGLQPKLLRAPVV